MTYDKTTGKFSGEIVTNQCRFFETASDTRHQPDCCAQKIGQATEFPSRGRVAWSIKGQNIYGPFEAGFGSEGTTLENSELTKNTKPPHPCYNEKKRDTTVTVPRALTHTAAKSLSMFSVPMKISSLICSWTRWWACDSISPSQ